MLLQKSLRDRQAYITPSSDGFIFREHDVSLTLGPDGISLRMFRVQISLEILGMFKKLKFLGLRQAGKYRSEMRPPA